MSWNYRVVRGLEPDGSKYYTIREGFYDSINETAPHSITAAPVYPGGATLCELRKDLALMLAAFDKVILEEWVYEDRTRESVHQQERRVPA